MIKKISSLLLSLAISINFAICASAADAATTEEAQSLLKALGIAKEMPYSVTVENYVSFLGGMLYESTSLSPDTIARMTGMIGENESLVKNTRIKYSEAVKYSVIALGYQMQAEQAKDYMQVAGQLGITDGIMLKADSGLTGDDATRLLMNMLDVEPMKSFHDGTGVIYESTKDETILSLNRGIEEIKGIVTANSITGLTREEGVGEGYIEIDGVVYETAGKFDELLGRNVYAYIKNLGAGEYELLYMHGTKNEEVEISGDKLDTIDGNYLMYYSEVNENKSEKALLSPTLRVIYNGVFLGDYTNEDLLPENGSVVLINNDRDNDFDVMIVESFKTVIVSGVIADKEVIVNKFRFDGSLKTISLDIENEDHYVNICSADGKSISFSNIAVNDVLSIAESKSNAPKVIKVYKSDKVIEGTLVSQNKNEETLTVGDVAYGYTSELYAQLEAETKTIGIGKDYRFYIDSFGNIVYAGFVNELDYYVFYRCYEEDEEFYIMYMDMDEMWNTAKLAKNTVLDGVKLSKDSVHKNVQYHSPQVAKIYFNSNGEVKELKFAQESNEADETRFIKSPEKQLVWRLTPKTFSGSVWMEDGAKVFVFPKDLKDREKYSVFEVSGYFRQDVGHKFVAYDMDEYGFTSILSANETDNSQNFSNSIFLVTDVYETFVDGEALSCVNGVFGEFIKYQLTGESLETFADVKPGDVIKTHTDRKTGRVDGISKIISVDSDNFEKSGESELYHNDRIITGIVKKADVARSRIQIDCGRDASFRLPSSVPVLIYDKSDRKCEKGTVANLTAGDKVVCRVPYIQFAEIIIIRD